MITLLTGDVRDVLPTIPDGSVQAVITSPPYYALRSYLDASHPDKHREIGSEPTPDAYIATMVGVFREVRRILRDDGVMFVNMGDSYAGGSQAAAARSGEYVGDGGKAPPNVRNRNGIGAVPGAKPKDLLMMPARLALALQQDGWWLRSDIIWAKPNPMPESVTDRPTSAHEHVFLLTKRARYFYDADAVREPQLEPGRIQAHAGGKRWDAERFEDRRDHEVNGTVYNPSGRNLRNVWTIATAPYSDCHFATFPPSLAERCIRAGTSERGACAACGAPWVRVVDKPTPPLEVRTKRRAPEDGNVHSGFNIDGHAMGSGQKLQNWLNEHPPTTTGWRASCGCNASVVPCTILDPFSGAGTALLVADRLGRDAIGIDLSHAYVEMARERLTADCPLFADINDAPVPVHPVETEIADLFAEAAA